MKIVIKSNNIFSFEKKIKEKYIIIHGNTIKGLKNAPPSNIQIIDLKELSIMPGLIDIHTHGAYGIDFMDLHEKNIDLLLKKYLYSGVTSVTPTMVADSFSRLKEIISFYSKYLVAGKYKDMIAGLHFESPYINLHAAGAQPKKHIRILSKKEKKFWIDARIKNNINIRLTIAPESGMTQKDIAELIKNKLILSIGHSAISYEDAILAFKLGVNSLTHTFNAMSGIHHRKPGPIIAAIENKNIFIELICDGLHLHPAIVRFLNLVFKDRLILVTDSIRAAGLQSGQYKLGDTTFYMKDNVCRLKDGTLAGSTLTMLNAFKNFKKFTGSERLEQIRYASHNPAKILKIDNILGDISAGYRADLIGLDKNNNLRFIMKDGIIIKT